MYAKRGKLPRAKEESFAESLEGSPDIHRRFDGQPQFGRFLINAHHVAVMRAGETALRADVQVFEGNVLGRLIDSSFQVILTSRAGTSN
jgi:hypothetical protein